MDEFGLWNSSSMHGKNLSGLWRHRFIYSFTWGGGGRSSVVGIAISALFSLADPLLSEYNRDSPTPLHGDCMEDVNGGLGGDLNSQSSSYLDDLHGDSGDLDELHLTPDDDLSADLFRTKKARLDTLLVEKMAGFTDRLEGEEIAAGSGGRSGGKKKTAKEPAVNSSSSNKVVVKKNYSVTGDTSKTWMHVETDQETLFGTTFKKKVWIREDWPELKKQERLRGFVWWVSSLLWLIDWVIDWSIDWLIDWLYWLYWYTHEFEFWWLIKGYSLLLLDGFLSVVIRYCKIYVHFIGGKKGSILCGPVKISLQVQSFDWLIDWLQMILLSGCLVDWLIDWSLTSISELIR